jgi:hypothetical protein
VFAWPHLRKIDECEEKYQNPNNYINQLQLLWTGSIKITKPSRDYCHYCKAVCSLYKITFPAPNDSPADKYNCVGCAQVITVRHPSSFIYSIRTSIRFCVVGSCQWQSGVRQSKISRSKAFLHYQDFGHHQLVRELHRNRRGAGYRRGAYSYIFRNRSSIINV